MLPMVELNPGPLDFHVPLATANCWKSQAFRSLHSYAPLIPKKYKKTQLIKATGNVCGMLASTEVPISRGSYIRP